MVGKADITFKSASGASGSLLFSQDETVEEHHPLCLGFV
jgi:hypothetical protein